MPQDSQHPNYSNWLNIWEKCRVACEGEDAVKASGEHHLPKLGGMTEDEYAAYLRRASWYGAPDRTVKGLTGAVMRRPPAVKFPDSAAYLMNSLGANGESVELLCRIAVTEVLKMGRCGILVDAPADGEGDPYLSIYYAENIINWKEEFVGGRKQLTRVVLLEEVEVQDANDPFVTDMADHYRVIEMGDDGYCVVTVWEKKERQGQNLQPGVGGQQKQEDEWTIVSGPDQPTFRGGSKLNFIPFIILSPEGLTATVTKPPLLDLVNTAYGYFRNSADLEHGLHFTALPTAWVAGFEIKSGDLRIGSSKAWVTENTGGHCGYLEFSGAGLGAIRTTMDEKKALMAVQGARLLEEQKADSESGAAIRLRHAGEQSILSHIVSAIGEGMTTALYWVAVWVGALPVGVLLLLNKDDDLGQKVNEDSNTGEESESPYPVDLTLNTDFNPLGIDTGTLTALQFLYQANLIPSQDVFWNLKRGELLPPTRTYEQWFEMIQSGGPQPPVPAGGGGFPPPGGGGGADPNAP